MSAVMPLEIAAVERRGPWARFRWPLITGAALALVAVTAGTLHYVGKARHAAEDSGLSAARAQALARIHAARRTPVAESAANATPASVQPPTRVAVSEVAADLFSPHSWYKAPPPPPPAPEPPAAAPSAPPVPYTYMGSYAPTGERPVYFLARGDRIIDAHVGDMLDGVLKFEKVEAGELVFTYVPLNTRQSLPAGVIQ